AVAAAALLNLALLGSFGWSELIQPGLLSALWLALCALWVGSALLSLVGGGRRGSGGQADPAGAGFERALEDYLKGNWYQAERLLGDLLRSSAGDLDARLMLATLLRHTGRFEEAAAQLDLLELFEGAGEWEWEVRRERELLSQARERIDGQDEEEDCGGSAHPPAEITPAA
ncbi:MAG: tetratricopeptide repeat protein, partial [Planctomycetota bacterium]